jgi:hypothetical protein
MKRIKVAQNRFLTLFRLESEHGTTTSFELVRRFTKPQRSLAVFKADQPKKALDAFTTITFVLKTKGLLIWSKTLKRILERSDDLSAGNRRYMRRFRTRKAKRKTPTNPILR